MFVYTLVALVLSLHANDPITGQMNYEAAEKYLNVACEYAGGECPSVPIVYATPMEKKYWGRYYIGTNIIMINDQCIKLDFDQDFCRGIILHEMIHYVTTTQGRMPDECLNEQFAWAVYNRYEQKIGRYDLVRLNWRDSYPQCQEKTDESNT